MKTKLSVSAVTLGLVAGAFFGSMSGVALADNPGEVRINETGQTYGSAAYVTNFEDTPDLILASATNGKDGYVYNSDLIGEIPRSPEEAAAQFEERLKPRAILVYESDGKTVIGEFIVSSDGVEIIK